MLSVSNEQLRIQAEIDPLTGLSNRHHLQTVMAERGGTGLEGTLYLLDVDHFKRINDQCGHAGGDTVLVEIARRLRHTLRDDDLIVRWGGEEFLVLVRPLPQAEAEALAQRLLCALADVPVCTKAGRWRCRRRSASGCPDASPPQADLTSTGSARSRWSTPRATGCGARPQWRFAIRAWTRRARRLEQRSAG
jgi:diguanylate cyclase (GGDEF)-like protein